MRGQERTPIIGGQLWLGKNLRKSQTFKSSLKITLGCLAGGCFRARVATNNISKEGC